MADAVSDCTDFHADAFPHASIFADVDNTGRTIGDLLTLPFTMPGYPPGRDDLAVLPKPTADEVSAMIDAAEAFLNERVRTNSRARKLVEDRFSGSDEARRGALCVVLYSMDTKPISVSRWMNAWLDAGGSLQASDSAFKYVGPFVVEYRKSIQLLPKMYSTGFRVVRNVAKVAKLRDAFANFSTVFAATRLVNFWGVAPFVRNHRFMNQEQYCGQPDDDAIIFYCDDMDGVCPALLSPDDEGEFQPLTPARFVVNESFQVQRKVYVSLAPVALLDPACYEAAPSVPSPGVEARVRDLTAAPASAARHVALAAALPECESVTVPGIGGMTRRQLFCKAIELDIKTIELRPRNASAYHNLGVTLAAAETVRSAKQRHLFLAALHLDPMHANAYHMLALTLSEWETVAVPGTVGALSQRQLFIRAIELDPTNAYAFHNLGFELSRSETVKVPGVGRMTKLQLYLKAVELEPMHAHAYYNLGRMLSGAESVTVPGIGSMSKQELHRKAIGLDSTLLNLHKG